MAATTLGTCQVVFVTAGDELGLDLLLAGPGSVEGRPLVAGSPLTLALVPGGGAVARALAVHRLSRWAATATPCRVAIRLDDDRALARLTVPGGHLPDRHVVGELTDLDVMFAVSARRERQD